MGCYESKTLSTSFVFFSFDVFAKYKIKIESRNKWSRDHLFLLMSSAESSKRVQ
jgi:hypothetical protein